MTQEGERRFRRVEAAEYIREKHQQPCQPSYLAKLASVGGGPQFELAGRWPLYRESVLDAWAQGRMSGPFRSTSEAKVAREALAPPKPSEAQPAAA